MTFFLRWIIRVQEQAFIYLLRPTLNKDNVKFQLKWEPHNIALGQRGNSEVVIKTKPYIIVHKAGTKEVLTKDNKSRGLASYLGITRYNTTIKRINNSKVHTYSPTFDLDVTFLQIGMKYSYQALKVFTINDTLITDVDLFSLPDGIIALQSDKCTKFNI